MKTVKMMPLISIIYYCLLNEYFVKFECSTTSYLLSVYWKKKTNKKRGNLSFNLFCSWDPPIKAGINWRTLSHSVYTSGLN